MVRKMRLNLDILPLFSAMAIEKQKESLFTRRSNKRKCLVTTGVTLEKQDGTVMKISHYFNNCHVVDTGVRKLSIYNPRLNMHMLEVRLVTREMANLRDRTGLTRDRTSVKIYSKATYEEMSSESDFSHLNEPATLQVLDLLADGKTDLAHHAWGGQAPHPDTLARAVQDVLAL